MKSDRLSFQGFRIKELLVRNKSSLKLLIAAGIGLAANGAPAWKVFFGAISKLSLDTLDYYLTEVEI